MKEKGFTLIEILAVIVIISITTLLIITNVEKRVKDAKKLLSNSQLETIENAVYVYAINYASEIPDLELKGIDTVSLSVLLDKGLIDNSDITINGEALPGTNVVLIAYINGTIKVKYDENQTGKSIIFIVGTDNISILKNSTYTDMGAYVAIPETGVIKLTSANMSSNVNTATIGTYQVVYTYTNSISATRTVNVL